MSSLERDGSQRVGVDALVPTLGGSASASTHDDTSSRDVRARLSLLIFLQFAAGGALYPFYGPYLSSKGLDIVEVSWVAMATAAAASASAFLWGAIADRAVPADRLVCWLHLAAAVVLTTLCRADEFAALVVAFALYAGLQQPTTALVSAISYHALEDPARDFGKLRLWGSVGWMLPSAPIALWLAIDPSRSLSVALVLTASIQALIVLLGRVWPPTPPIGARRPARFRADLARLVRIPGFVPLLVVASLTMASFAVMFYFTGLALEMAGLDRHWLGPVQAIGVALEVPLFLLLRRLLEGLGFKAVLALGISAAAVRQAIFASTDDLLLLSAATLLIAPAVVLFLIAGSLAVDRLAPREVRATAQSLWAIAGSGLGTVGGLLVSGLVSERNDLGRPFLAAAASALLALIVLLWTPLDGVRGRAPGPTAGSPHP